MQGLVDASFVLPVVWGIQQSPDHLGVPFFDHVLFPWVEVMSLEDNLKGVIHSMNRLLNWLGKVSSTHSVSVFGQFLR